MFPGRIGALRGARRRDDDDPHGLNRLGVKKPWLRRSEILRRQREAELEDLKESQRMDEVNEFDLYESTKKVLRFRKYPWPHWFCGFLFLGGSLLCIWLAYEKLL